MFFLSSGFLFLLLLHPMGQKKLQRFAEIETFPNVLIYPPGMTGRWAQYFGNAHSLTLELACGKGEYSLGMARLFPQRNFIGVDLKGNRLWRGAKTALEEGLTNVAFLRTQIGKLTDYFGQGEVAEIWITFPDPFLRGSRAKKRLTHPKFLELYRQVLLPDGKIHLKTDSLELYAFTKEVIEETGCLLQRDEADIDRMEETDPLLQIQTYYERLHRSAGKVIRYLQFSLPEVIPQKNWKKIFQGSEAKID